MKKTRYTEEQIAFALKQAETGTRVEEVCRKMGISEATFYNWKKKFGGMGVTKLRRLRQLEEENQRLKRLVADLSLDKVMLQEVIKKSSEVAAKFLGDDIFAEFLFEGFIIILPDLDHAIDRSVDVLLEHALNLHEVCASSG